MLYFSMFFAGDFDLGYLVQSSQDICWCCVNFLKFQCVAHVKAGAGLLCGDAIPVWNYLLVYILSVLPLHLTANYINDGIR